MRLMGHAKQAEAEFVAIARRCFAAVPTTVVVGDRDPVAAPWAQLANHLRRTAPLRFSFHVVPGAGHYPWKDDPTRTLHAIHAHASRIPAG